jgi:hypothetical protein
MHHREPAAAPRPRPVVRAERKRSLRPVELPVTAGQVPAAARPPARLTPAPGAVTAAAAVVPTPPARAAAGLVRAASVPILGVLDRVAGAGAASPAGPVVTRAAATVDAVVGALG